MASRRHSRKFSTAFDRLRWADGNIRELESRLKTFFQADIYERVTDGDSNGVYRIDKIRLTKPIPDKFTELCVSAIENLRSSLDHAATATVLTKHKRTAAFIVADTKEELTDRLSGTKGKCLPPEILSLFKKLKPYRSGSPALWALNELCNTHKHRTLIEPAVHLKRLQFDSPKIGFRLGILRLLFNDPHPRWNRRKNEIIITSVAGDVTAHHDVEILVSIAFGKVPFFGGKPVLAGLRYLLDICERIVVAVETESRRIGIDR